jgi:hypothetical protein
MLWGAHAGGLELRRSDDGSHHLRGRFPYGKPAVLSDGGRNGRPQKEVIEPRAFSYRVDLPGEDIHLLVGHDYDMPLASKKTGTLNLRDTAEALVFDATNHARHCRNDAWSRCPGADRCRARRWHFAWLPYSARTGRAEGGRDRGRTGSPGRRDAPRDHPARARRAALRIVCSHKAGVPGSTGRGTQLESGSASPRDPAKQSP